MWVFIFQKYGKFSSVLLEHFIKHKPLFSEECLHYNSEPIFLIVERHSLGLFCSTQSTYSKIRKKLKIVTPQWLKSTLIEIFSNGVACGVKKF